MDPNTQQILATAQMLSDKEEYEQALACVATMNCIMGEWMRGKIYFDSALKTLNSIIFRHYCTPEMETKYRDTLNAAKAHLSNVGDLMSNTTKEIKDTLNDLNYWHQSWRVNHELMVIENKELFKEDEDDLDLDLYEGDEIYYARKTECLINNISEWSLNRE